MQHLPNTNDRSNGSMQTPLSMPGTTNASNGNSKIGKSSFLVFKQNKYMMIPTQTIAFFYIKYNLPVIVCFDKQEYFVNYSLDHTQELLSDVQFFRVNRQYLVNVHAIAAVEHYFARKLLVKLVIPVPENLLVSKEKASTFLRWLENR